MKPTLFQAIIAITLLTILAPSPATAQSPSPNEKEEFLISCLRANWTTQGTHQSNSYIYDIASSNTSFGGVFWNFENAAFSDQSNYIQIGDPMFTGITSIVNESPLAIAPSLVTVGIQIPTTADITKLNSLRLRISSDKSFTDAEDIYTEDPVEHNAILHFPIPDPQPDKYYRLEFNVTYTPYSSKSATYILAVQNLTFYSLRSTTPVFDSEPENGKCRIVSESGPLHLIATEYNSDGSVFRDIIEEDRRAPARTVALDDTTWTNKVAEEGEEFYVPLPTDSSHLLHIRAKSQKPDGSFSDEISKIYTADGIETATSPLQLSDHVTHGTPVYYDFTGRRLSSRPGGPHIQIINNQPSKIITR